MRLKQRQKIIGAVSILAFLSFFLPTHFAHAYFWDVLTPEGLITAFLQQVFLGIQGLTAITAKALSLAVYVRAGGSIPVVAATWTILRDFSNMLFIIMLIYMAFATIFDQGNYTFKSMIVRFLIVAILINFSLVIGNLVIDACQVLSNIFLGSIGNLGDRLGSLLNPSVLLNSTNPVGAADLAGASLASLLFAIILALIFLFSIIVATTFSIIRIPIIWGLLIVSPLAWMSHVLPGSNTWWKQWWSQFVGWNLFLPVYLFFMYLGLMFLSQRNQIMNAVIQVNSTGGANPANAAILWGSSNTLTFNLLFFYIFAAVVMVGGTWAATRTTSILGGTGFDKGVHWAKELGHNIWPYTQVRPAIQAGKDRLEQLKQEGLPGPLGKVWRGQQGYQSDVQKWGGVFGVRNKEETKVSTDVSNAKTRFQNMDTTELRARINSGNDFEKLAARELLKERNQLTNTEQVQTYQMYQTHSEQAALKFANSIDYKKLSEPERTTWLDRTTNTELLKKIVTSKAEQGDYNDAAGVVQASTFFTSDTDRAAFIKKAAKRLSDAEIARIRTTAGFRNSREENVAINEALAQKQALSGTEIINAYNQLGAGSEEGEKFLSGIKFPALSEPNRRQLFNARAQISDIETKHKLFDAMAEKGELNVAELEETARTYGGSEQKEFLKKSQAEKFVRTAEVRRRLSLLPGGTPIANLHESIVKQIEKLKPEDIAGLPKEDAWDELAFRTALEQHFVDLEGRPGGGPQPAQLLNPALPFDQNTNPVVAPGRVGRGTELKRDIIKATRDGSKLGRITAMVGTPAVPVPP